MKRFINITFATSMLAIACLGFSGCSSSTDSGNKMSQGDSMMSGTDNMSQDKMDDKMESKMEGKMDDKMMSGDRMSDEKMGSDKMVDEKM